MVTQQKAPMGYTQLLEQAIRVLQQSRFLLGKTQLTREAFAYQLCDLKTFLAET